MNKMLSPAQIDLLNFLDDEGGCDIWSHHEAVTGRELEKLGFIFISPARRRNPDGAARQPYFGIELSEEGRQALIAASKGQPNA